MSTFNSRLLYRSTVAGGDAMDLSTALDLIEFRELDIVVYVHEAGTGEAPKLVVEHAPSNEEGAYLAFDVPFEAALDSAGATWARVPAFTRWIAWRTTGTLSASAVVTLNLIARS